MKDKVIYFIILTGILFSAVFIFSTILISAESEAMYARQMQHLYEFCYSKNYSCIGPNPYNNIYCEEFNPDPNCNDTEAQNYNMREYCCENNLTSSENLPGNKNALISQLSMTNGFTWIIIILSVIILTLIIVHLKSKRKH